MVRNFTVKKVRKQMYPATYNFMDEADDTAGTSIDFVDAATTGANTTLKIIAVQNGHRKVIEMYDNDGAARVDFSHEFTAQTYGTVEFWLSNSDVSKVSQYRLMSGAATTVIYILRFSGSNLQYYAGGGAGWTTHAGATNDQWYHIKVDFECTAGGYESLAQFEYHITIDGTKYSDFDFFNDEANIDEFFVYTDVATSGYYNYIDACGESWDTDYKIGDNCFWRHYKDQDSDFETEDVGTTGTSIDFVDVITDGTEGTIISEFNEHKKILENADIGGSNKITSNCVATTSGTIEFWFKSNDVTARTNIQLHDTSVPANIIYLRMDASELKYHIGAVMTATGLTMVNDTWYHIKLQLYTDDTFDYWIDNILYADGVACNNGMTTGIDRFFLTSYVHTDYIDAVSYSWTTGNEVGDNRILDYNDTYTREDITDKILNCTYENKYFLWRKAILYSNTEYTKAEVFFQIHDINSKLTMEGEIKQAIWNGATWTIPLRDKNEDALKNRSSNTFSSTKIHDPTDSGCILKTIIPTVGQVDGRLILVNADTKTDTYSPVTKNYPDIQMLLVISDLGDSSVIIEASGKVHFDDDLASGSALDYDTSADRDYFTGDPITSNILEDYNYFEIFGAMNPDGARFYKVIDNTGSDEKHPFRITNNEFRTQTDVDAYAAKIAARTIDVRDINLPLQSMGVHDMGETFDYKYTNTEFIIPQANYYIVSEKMNMDMATSVLVLSEGLMEESKYAAVYERPENYNDSFAAEIYETDYVIINPHINNHGSDNSSGFYWESNAAAEGVGCNFYTEAEMDTTRDMTITITYQRNDANNDTVDCLKYLRYAACDGVDNAWTGVWVAAAELLPADANNDYNKVVLTVSNTDINAGSLYNFYFLLNEIRIFYWFSISVKYYIKRTL